MHDKEELDEIVPGIVQAASVEEDKELEPIQKSYL